MVSGPGPLEPCKIRSLFSFKTTEHNTSFWYILVHKTSYFYADSPYTRHLRLPFIGFTRIFRISFWVKIVFSSGKVYGLLHICRTRRDSYSNRVFIEHLYQPKLYFIIINILRSRTVPSVCGKPYVALNSEIKWKPSSTGENFRSRASVTSYSFLCFVMSYATPYIQKKKYFPKVYPELKRKIGFLD